jgi:hypothetical protein
MNKSFNLKNYIWSNSLVSLLKKEIERLKNNLITQKIEVDKRVNDSQRLISTLRLALNSFDGGADVLKKIESNTYIEELLKDERNFNKKSA